MRIYSRNIVRILQCAERARCRTRKKPTGIGTTIAPAGRLPPLLLLLVRSADCPVRCLSRLAHWCAAPVSLRVCISCARSIFGPVLTRGTRRLPIRRALAPPVGGCVAALQPKPARRSITITQPMGIVHVGWTEPHADNHFQILFFILN